MIVTIEGIKIELGVKKESGTLLIDSIKEFKNNVGVTIETVLLKDGNVDGRNLSVDGAKLDAIDQGLAKADSPTFAGLTLSGIFDAEALSADVNLFKTDTVGDGADGQSLYIYRKAAEGTDYIRAYTDQYRRLWLYSNRSFYMDAAGYIFLQFSANEDIYCFYSSASGDNRKFRIFGYITAAGASKWAGFQVDDVDDYFHLLRGDANILGFKVDMPLNVPSHAIHAAGLKSGTDQANAGAVVGELYVDTNDDNTIKRGV